MKFKDFYNTLYKHCEEEHLVDSYRVRVAHISGWTYYEGTIGSISITTFKLLSVFNVENTKIDINTRTFVVYVN